MTDRIERTVDLKAPVSRVWKALTDHKEFGTWFRVKLDAPLAPGRVSCGHKTSPGLEHLKWEAMVQTIEPERRFSFTWHPFSAEPGTDYSEQTSNLVEFTLEAIPSGTRLRVVESGFDKLLPSSRDATFRRHDDGWSTQMQNITRHVEQQV
ncbi:SRPBCC family protein [Reyranella soli]|uniref:Activator of Hsp90 ATPase homologue 1/2-like C-terminal domain-containing protein n=1 Tax=Reyranella soli TaxID=1230389 RepID=A0A512NAM9_9HYPH|nr:SRPBCC family protein [Reyranella soli]GEP56018.1 hypothetical protein RSO01_31840 [Reyranella soli]